jgi:hypothetical protein
MRLIVKGFALQRQSFYIFEGYSSKTFDIKLVWGLRIFLIKWKCFLVESYLLKLFLRIGYTLAWFIFL